jgi:hypothetical protein
MRVEARKAQAARQRFTNGKLISEADVSTHNAVAWYTAPFFGFALSRNAINKLSHAWTLINSLEQLSAASPSSTTHADNYDVGGFVAVAVASCEEKPRVIIDAVQQHSSTARRVK